MFPKKSLAKKLLHRVGEKIRLVNFLSVCITFLQITILACSIFYSLIPLYAEMRCLYEQIQLLTFFLDHIFLSGAGTNRTSSVTLAGYFSLILLSRLVLDFSSIYQYSRRLLTNFTFTRLIESYIYLTNHFKQSRSFLFKLLVYPLAFVSITASLQGMNINVPSYIVIPLSIAAGLMTYPRCKAYLLWLYAKALQPILKNEKTDPNEYISGYSPLFYALITKNFPLIENLIQRGANPNLSAEKAGLLTPIWSYFFPNKPLLEKPLLLWCLENNEPKIAETLLKLGLNCLPEGKENECHYAFLEHIDKELSIKTMLEFIDTRPFLTEQNIHDFLENHPSCDETMLRDFIKTRDTLTIPEFLALKEKELPWYSLATRYLEFLTQSKCLPKAEEKSGVSSLFELAATAVKNLKENTQAEQLADPVKEHLKTIINLIPISKHATEQNKAFYKQLVDRPAGMFRP